MSKELFVGAWKLVNSEMRVANGDVHYPLGEDCDGRLIFDTEGNFTAQLMRVGRPEFASGDILRGTPEEVQAAYEGFVSFWGASEVDASQDMMSYVVEGSLFPNWIGKTNIRYYKFEGRRMTLTTPKFLLAGEETVGVLTWERLG